MRQLPAKYAVVVALLISPSSVAFSETAAEEKVIIPIAIQNAAGALGSVWHSGSAAFNASDTLVLARLAGSCPVGCGNGEGFAPGESSFVYLASAPIERPGRVLFFKQGEARSVKIMSTLVESGRSPVFSPGVSIAPVYESDLFTGPMHLVDLVTNPTFRLRLRLYSPESTAAGSFRLRIFSMYTQDLLFDGTILMSPADSEFSPAYGEFSDFPMSDYLIRVQIDPLTPGVRYWGFVSTTSNDTEAVNITLPSKP